MKKSILVAMVAILVMACESSKTNIVFEQKEVTFEASNDLKSATVNLKFPFAKDTIDKRGQMVADSINRAIEALLTPEAAIDEAKQMFKDSINYEDMCEWSGVRNDEVISILLINYLYSGGAHGGMNLQNLTFDAKTGKRLSLRDQITDTVKFRTLFLEHFYKQNNLTAQTPMEDVGYLVPLNELGIPSVLNLATDGLVCTYAQYEVAAYVVGMPSATIPYDQLQGLLKIDTKDLKKIETVK